MQRIRSQNWIAFGSQHNTFSQKKASRQRADPERTGRRMSQRKPSSFPCNAIQDYCLGSSTPLLRLFGETNRTRMNYCVAIPSYRSSKGCTGTAIEISYSEDCAVFESYLVFIFRYRIWIIRESTPSWDQTLNDTTASHIKKPTVAT